MSHEQPIDFDSISELIPKAKQGDDEAFNGLLAELRDRLLALARRRLSPAICSKEGHSDVVQKTLLEAVESFDRFRGSTAGEFNCWIQAILENVVKEAHRSFASQKRDLARETSLGGAYSERIRAAEQTPGSLAEAKDELRSFYEALETLPPDYAQVIRLRSLDKMSFKEVSVSMGRSYDSVSQLWYRAMLRLEEEVNVARRTTVKIHWRRISGCSQRFEATVSHRLFRRIRGSHLRLHRIEPKKFFNNS